MVCPQDGVRMAPRRQVASADRGTVLRKLYPIFWDRLRRRGEFAKSDQTAGRAESESCAAGLITDDVRLRQHPVSFLKDAGDGLAER